MSGQDVESDLIVLVADKDTEMAIKGILERTASLAIRQIRYRILVHPRHDPGCLLSSHSFLQPFVHSYSYAIVVFDREGCGKDTKTREELEEIVENLLDNSGWENRAKAIVIDPELEIWVWKNSPHVGAILGWKSIEQTVQSWLKQQGYFPEGVAKPPRPKEAMDAVLRFVKKPHSSAIFNQLALQVSLKQCNDPSFQKLKSVLQEWFSS